MERVSHFLRRNLPVVLAALGGLVAAVVIVAALTMPPEDIASPQTDLQTAAPATAAPTAEVTQSPGSAIYPTNYQIVDGLPLTDRPLGLAEGAQVDDSFFNDAVFVGDSVTLKLRQYVIKQRSGNYPTLLGNAQFLAKGSFSSHEALSPVTEKSLHPTVNGVKMTLEDALAAMNAQKVYLMLGMNDVAHVGIDESATNMITLIGRIREKLPNAQIFVESATPRYAGEKPKTESLFEYDIKLYDQLAALQLDNVYFVDVAYVMRDEAGKLIESYCSDREDMAMHFTDAGCKEWIKYLYTHTPPVA